MLKPIADQNPAGCIRPQFKGRERLWHYGKNVLKRLRSFQPFNRLVTSTLRAGLEITGSHSEFFIKHLPRTGGLRRRLPNGRSLRLWSRGDDWVSNQVYWRGWQGYEPETAPLFFRLATRAQVTLDIGAHVGYYALLAGHANPAGRVYAFEPFPATYARLQHNVALNRLSNVTCFASAVGELDGAADFFHPGTLIPCSASLSFDIYRPWADSVTKMTVPVITLDRFVEEHQLGHVDLVKLDVESAEPQVLRGATKVLQRDRPTIICEVLKGCGTEQALETALRPYGYRFYLVTPDGPALRERIEGHEVWLNYLFTTNRHELVVCL